MLNYIIQILLFQVLFIAIYDAFLSRETFFNGNRFYLLSTAILSFVLPRIKLTGLQKVVRDDYLILLPEIVLSPQKVIEKSVWYQHISYLDVAFWLGVAVFSMVFMVKVYKIIQLITANKQVKNKHYVLVLVPKTTKAFSFFKYIFIGEEIPDPKRNTILAHELVHCNEKHTLDLLFFEILKIVMWFNPMIYVYQHRIALVHEFISDKKVSQAIEKKTYINNLLSEIFQVEHIAFVNQFYKKSLLKKRIVMITKTQSNKLKQLKYLLLVPILTGMLFYTSCSEETNEVGTTSLLKNQTVYFNADTLQKKVKNKLSLMDIYFGSEPNFKELTFKDLTDAEKEEFQQVVDNFNENEVSFKFIFRIFEDLNGRKIVYHELDKTAFTTKTNTNEETLDAISFSNIDEVPAFEGKGTTKADFNKNMIQYVKDNFNTDLANSLGLEAGKKRVYVQFTINKEGIVEQINARAPHKSLKEEAIRLIENMPKLTPGVHQGKKVAVNYVLPISFEVQ